MPQMTAARPIAKYLVTVSLPDCACQLLGLHIREGAVHLHDDYSGLGTLGVNSKILRKDDMDHIEDELDLFEQVEYVRLAPILRNLGDI